MDELERTTRRNGAEETRRSVDEKENDVTDPAPLVG